MTFCVAKDELLREGFAIQFLSKYSGCACFESITGARDGIMRSTVTGYEIAFWPTREDAVEWLTT